MIYHQLVGPMQSRHFVKVIQLAPVNWLYSIDLLNSDQLFVIYIEHQQYEHLAFRDAREMPEMRAKLNFGN